MAENKFNVRDHVRRERHAEVFDWLCEIQGKTPERLVSEILTSVLVRELPTYREWKGGGGNSSLNLEQLAQRLK